MNSKPCIYIELFAYSQVSFMSKEYIAIASDELISSKYARIVKAVFKIAMEKLWNIMGNRKQT